jgi:hypothetical protein
MTALALVVSLGALAGVGVVGLVRSTLRRPDRLQDARGANCSSVQRSFTAIRRHAPPLAVVLVLGTLTGRLIAVVVGAVGASVLHRTLGHARWIDGTTTVVPPIAEPTVVGDLIGVDYIATVAVASAVDADGVYKRGLKWDFAHERRGRLHRCRTPSTQ